MSSTVIKKPKIWEIPSYGAAAPQEQENEQPQTEPIKNELGDELAITQGSSINWYFGENAGIRFNEDGTIQVLTDGLLNQDEGAYTVSDAQGNLLFYTDGEVIFDRNHDVMETGLFGHDSAATSAVVAVQPNTSLYWIFTVDRNTGSRGLNYTIVDLSLNGGLGAVTLKNQNLQPGANSTEKLAMVRHANGIDWWIIAHGYNNNEFYAYLLTESGLGTTPVITAIGLAYTDTVDKTGYIKDNFAQDKLAVTTFGSTRGNKSVELFDFDNATGVLSNAKLLGTYHSPYGVEFTQNDKYLYFVETAFAQYTYDRIWRYEMATEDPPILYWERTTGSTSPYHIGMQIANNGKIYISFNFKSSLSFIDDPESEVETMQIDALDISPGRARTGLPYFPKAYLKSDGTVNAPIQSGSQERQVTVITGQTVYSLDNTGPSAIIETYYFGLKLTENIHYTLNAAKNQITFSNDIPLENGDVLTMKY